MMRRWLATVGLVLLAVGSMQARVPEQQAMLRDAYVEFDRAASVWTIGNAQMRYALEIHRDRRVELVGLTPANGANPVTSDAAPDALVTAHGETVRVGAAGGDFYVADVDATAGSHFVSMAFRFVAATSPFILTRHYVVYPGAPVVEMWTEIEGRGADRVAIENLNAFAVRLEPGAIEWTTGLDAAEAVGGSFSSHARLLSPGESLRIGSPTLSTEIDMPHFSVSRSGVRVIGGLLWSGAWSGTFDRADDALAVTMGLPPMSAWTRVGEPIEGPHGFIGVVDDTSGAETAAMSAFVLAGRGGRPLPALTTFNTWFVHGINIDERTVQRDIDLAAGLGLEQLQLDAGWYPHDDRASTFDFTDGLGSWTVDPARFPSGLASLVAQAHERGLEFGLWVEPERVALSTVGRPGLADESFLAQQDGAYQPGTPNEEAHDAQICLADRGARAWVLSRVFTLLDEIGPDSLKWDFNRWVHCTRSGHGHPIDGGNYAHTRALYEILAAIRERYPALAIENCAGGGHRLDFALARLTDSAWMDDRSAPSSHVRRNLHGLMRLFPAPYLYSFVMPHPDEPIRGANDIAVLVRSRLPGMVGLATSLSELDEREYNELHQQFSLVKSLRDAQSDAVTYLLTPRSGLGGWEVVQQLAPASGRSVIVAVADGSSDSIVLPLRGVRADLLYELRSADRGPLGRLRGDDLSTGGLTIVRAPESAAQVLVLEPAGSLDVQSVRR